jgi:O-antigen ligase
MLKTFPAEFSSFTASLPLLILASLLLFSPLLEGGTTHLAVMVIRLQILLLLALYFWKGFRADSIELPSFPLWPAVVGYLLLAVYSTALSPYRHQSIQWLVVLCSYAILLYLIVFFVTRWEHITGLLGILVALGLLEAIWALIQGWQGVARPTGTFFNANFLAGYLASIWTIVFGGLCFLKLRHEQGSEPIHPKLFRPVAVGLLGILATVLLAIVSTGSRGGMAAVMIGAGGVLGMRYGRRAIGAIMIFLLIVLIVPNPVRDRFWSQYKDNPIGYARWQIWKSSLQTIGEHPSGVGLGLYQYVYPRYAAPVEGMITRYGNVAHTAHNEYLQMGVELGMPSMLIFLWGVWLIGREVVVALKQRMKGWQRGVLVGSSVAVGGILAQGAVDSNLHEPAIVIVLVLCVGIILSLRRIGTSSLPSDSSIPARFRILWTGCVGAALVVIGCVVIRFGMASLVFESGTQAAAQRDLSSAIASYQSAIDLDPQKALYYSAMSGAYFQMFQRTGDREVAQSAVDALRKAIQLNPLDGRLPGLLGHVCSVLAEAVSQGDSSGTPREAWLQFALSAYEQAAFLEPYTVSYKLELGRVRLALGDREGAERAVQAAVDMEPNFLPAREWLSKIYVQSNRFELGVQQYREIVARQQQYQSWAKGDLEASFLKADVAGLASLLGQERPRT